MVSLLDHSVAPPIRLVAALLLTMPVLWAFALLARFAFPGAETHPIRHDSILAVTSGTFYTIESLTGEPVSKTNRRDLSQSGLQTMRLDLGPEAPLVASLEMTLRQDSAWTDDSVVTVVRGDKEEEFGNSVERSCFLSGRLTSQAGAASLNRCGRLSGIIQTDDFYYEIEEDEEDNDIVDDEISTVRVTVRRSRNLVHFDDVIFAINDSSSSSHEKSSVENNASRTRREFRPVTAEVGVYLDANFVRHITYVTGRTTNLALTQWMILRWNVIRNVYSYEAALGVSITLQLKKVEIWRNNPRFMARVSGPNRETGEVLGGFCGGRPNSPFDHKMLYTYDTGQSNHIGMAYLDGICRKRHKCSLVKAWPDSVKIELHELGHNFGLEHDPELHPCTDPEGEGGFMGWGVNYRILDCYRREITRRVLEPEAQCLYEVNVPHRRVLNPKLGTMNGNPHSDTTPVTTDPPNTPPPTTTTTEIPPPITTTTLP